jgi:serine/threonine protein kinase
MERDRWIQIERLYHAALERGPDARDTFLAEACAGDESRRGAVFAVGVMVVESLTGRRPFEGKSHAELLTAVLHQTFTLPGDAPAVRRLDAVLRKCLAKERTSRYATVIELQGALIPALKACPQLSSLCLR